MRYLRSLFLVGLFTVIHLGSRADILHKVDSLTSLLRKSNDTTAINILNQIAWEYRMFDLSKTDSFARLANARSNQIGYDKGIGQAYNCLALVERNSGNYKEAIDNARWALLHFIRIHWLPGYSSCYNTIASIHHIQGKHAIALYYYINSQRISESLRDKMGMARTLNNIGAIHMELEDYDKALIYLNRAYDILEELGEEDALADELINIANVYQYTGKREQAIEYYQRAVAINKHNNNLKGVATGFNNIGTVYADLNQYKEALNVYFQALAIDESIGDIESMILAYENIAACYIKLNMLHSATTYVQNALSLAKKHELNSYIVGSYKQLYEIEVMNRNFESALEFHKLYKAYDDSMTNQASAHKISFLEKQYLKEKAEKQEILQSKDSEISARIHNEKEKRINQYIFLIGLMLLIFVIVIYVVFFMLKWQKPGI